jgi:hypothetical protein
VSNPVSYTAVLPARESTVALLSGLLAAERRRRGTRGRRRALGCYRQAVLVLRWFLDGTRLAQLAADNRIGSSTAYRYLHEGIDVLAAAAPGLRGALLAARAAGHPRYWEWLNDQHVTPRNGSGPREAGPGLPLWVAYVPFFSKDLGIRGEGWKLRADGRRRRHLIECLW